MNNFKLRLILITLVLLVTAISIFIVGDEKNFLDSGTSAQIEQLKGLSLHHASELGITEQQRQSRIIKLIKELEQHAQRSSQIAADRFNELIGYLRWNVSNEDVVLSMLSPAAYDVRSFVDAVNKLRNICGIVL